MASQLRLALIEPDIVLRSALEEQFTCSGEFQAVSANSLNELVVEGASLSHIDVLLAGHIDEDLLSDAVAKGFQGPAISLSPTTSIAVTLTRPFRYAALAMAIRSALHDHTRSDEARFALGPYEFNPADRSLAANGKESIRLTDKEAAILRYLHRTGEQPVSREELLGEVWGYQSGVTTHTLETHIYRLRQKIEPNPSEATLLVTVAGGYRLGPIEG